MPKIPLYSERPGSAVPTPAGSLGPRMSAQSLASAALAPARLVGQAAEAATKFAANEMKFEQEKAKIDFEFSMAEKERDDKRIVREQSTAVAEQMNDLVMRDTSTSTGEFDAMFGSEAESIRESIKGLGYTPRRTELVTNAVESVLSRARMDGQQKAFARGQEQSGIAANEALDANMRQMATLPGNHPERQRLLAESIGIIQDGRNEGLKTGYTENSFSNAVIQLDYERLADGATTRSQIDELKDRLSTDTTLSANNATAVKQYLKQADTRVKNETFELTAEQVRDISVNVANINDMDAISDSLTNNDPVDIEFSNGDVSTFDPRQFTNRERVQLGQLVSQLQQRVRSDIYQSGVEDVNNLADKASQQQLAAAANSMKKTGVATVVTTDGTTETIDMGQLDPTQWGAVSQLFTSAAEKAPNLIAAQAMAAGKDYLMSTSSQAGAVQGMSVLYDPKQMEMNGQTLKNVDDVLINSVQQTVSTINSEHAAGNLSPAEAAARLNIAKAVLNNRYTEGTSAAERNPSSGKAALDAITSARNSLKTAVTKTATINAAANSLLNNTFVANPSLTNMSNPDKQKAIQAAVTEIVKTEKGGASDVFKMLEQNSVTYDEFSGLLNNGADIGMGMFDNLDPDSEEYAKVMQSLELYRAIKEYPSIVDRHVGEDQRGFFDSVLRRSTYVPMERAVMNQAKAMKLDYSATIKESKILKELDEIKSKVNNDFFARLGLKGQKIKNRNAISQTLKRRVKDYMELGNGEKDALEMASKDIIDTHVFVLGQLFKKNVNTPFNIGDLAKAGVAEIVNRSESKMPGTAILTGEYDSDELSFIISENGKIFTLVEQGVHPVLGAIVDENGKIKGASNITFTAEELQSFNKNQRMTEIQAGHQSTMDNERRIAEIMREDKAAEKESQEALQRILSNLEKSDK